MINFQVKLNVYKILGETSWLSKWVEGNSYQLAVQTFILFNVPGALAHVLDILADVQGPHNLAIYFNINNPASVLLHFDVINSN
jgi:hypothetical protein